eukprot:Gb_27224 [translate_table: standard]
MNLPTPGTQAKRDLAFNLEEAKLEVDIKNGGCAVVLTSENLPILRQLGFGADLVRIDMVVGIDGERVLEIEVKLGCLFIVPWFFVVSKIVGDEGMEWFSIITTPIYNHVLASASLESMPATNLVDSGELPAMNEAIEDFTPEGSSMKNCHCLSQCPGLIDVHDIVTIEDLSTTPFQPKWEEDDIYIERMHYEYSGILF